MYNNVGLSTACSSCSNAYVQSNVANLSFSRNKIVYNAEEDIARAEAKVNEAPNLELKKANTTILKEANITQDKAALEKEMEKSMMEKLWKKSRKSVNRRRKLKR
uniref:Uncharacterized protein n=1 Tax=Meloidogyne javanica TaxID=6303 RepID=A0A915MAH8_MELJA